MEGGYARDGAHKACTAHKTTESKGDKYQLFSLLISHF